MIPLNPQAQHELASIMDAQEKQVRKKLATNKNKTFAIQSIRLLHEQVDQLAEHVKRKPHVKFDCAPGCAHCCTLRVEALPPEIFALARHLRTLPPVELANLQAKLATHAGQAKGVFTKDFYLPCPLLNEGKCSVYSLRPSMCRKYFSMDVKACEKGDVEVPEDAEMSLKTSALLAGTIKAYDRAKLAAQTHELGQALHLALADPGIEDKWFRGAQVFEPLPELADQL